MTDDEFIEAFKGISKKRNMPNPTLEEVNSPLFNAIWNVIKNWDIGISHHYDGYTGASGSHVKIILDAIKSSPADVFKGLLK